MSNIYPSATRRKAVELVRQDHLSYEAAAKIVGCGSTTVLRWIRPEVAQRENQHKADESAKSQGWGTSKTIWGPKLKMFCRCENTETIRGAAEPVCFSCGKAKK